MTTNSTDKIRNDNVILTETCKQLFGYILETKDNNVIVDELKSILKLSAVPTGRYKTVFKHILKMRENGEEINILSLGDSLNKTDELEQFGGLSTVASLTTGILPMGSIKHSVSRIKRAARDHANKEAIEKYADNPTKLIEQLKINDEKFEITDNGISELRKKSYSITELLDTEFPMLVWFTERIITTGLTLLWGFAKSGKSILILHILLAVAQGGRALGVLKCQKVSVLLISLEDGARRLQTRLKGAGATPTDNFSIFTDWPRGQEGIDRLRQYLDENLDVKIVVIDTLFLFTKIQDGNDYTQTVTIMESLKRIADDRDMSIIVIHHSKKMGKDNGGDILESALGSTGIVAGPDHLLYLKRTPAEPADAVLHFVSKDTEPAELALKFDNEIMGWAYAGEAADMADTDERQEILDLLRKEGSLKPGEIATKLNKKTPAVSNLLKKMVSKEQVRKIHYGLYCLNGGSKPHESGESVKVEREGTNNDSPIHDFHGGMTEDTEETQDESNNEEDSNVMLF
jgi:hypothetical protein